MLEKHLQTLGLTTKEIKVYLATAEIGRGTAQAIAKRAGLPRTTIYGFVDDLTKRGLLIKEPARDTTFFSIRDPSAILRLVEEERRLVEQKSFAAKELQPLLKSLISSERRSLPKLLYFEGKKNVENALYELLPKWRESYRKLNNFELWGYQDHAFVTEYRRWHEYAWGIRDERERIHLFSTEEGAKQQAADKITNREVKQLPLGLAFPGSIWVRGDYVLLSITREDPHYMIVVMDSVLAETLRRLFKILWHVTGGTGTGFARA